MASFRKLRLDRFFVLFLPDVGVRVGESSASEVEASSIGDFCIGDLSIGRMDWPSEASDTTSSSDCWVSRTNFLLFVLSRPLEISSSSEPEASPSGAPFF